MLQDINRRMFMIRTKSIMKNEDIVEFAEKMKNRIKESYGIYSKYRISTNRLLARMAQI